MSVYALIEPTLRALNVQAQDLQVADAVSLARRRYPNLSADRPALIGPLPDAEGRANLRVVLQQAYPDGHTVTLICHAKGSLPVTRSLPLGQLDQAFLSAGTCILYVPPLPYPTSVETFQNTVARLRAPDGCPWDREQTHRSLRQGFQEESYEVLDALDQGSSEHLKEELGDILLHILLQAQIAAELGEFRLGDVIRHANQKIVFRHPHVFADLPVDGIDEILVNWETLKQQEKESRAEPEATRPSPLDGIAQAMPALARAQSIQRHVDRFGVVAEEVDQLAVRITAALQRLIATPETAEREQLLGDLLFDLANLSRKLHIDAETALREANSHFEKQYRDAEGALGAGPALAS
jgi:tetrapyrrole methylase family protein / MazG family protein